MRPFAFVLALVLASLSAHPLPAGEIRGVIVNIDLEKKEIQVEGRGLGRRGLMMTFSLTPETRVLLDNERGRLLDLRVGQLIRLEGELLNGRPSAAIIRGGKAPAMMKPGAPATPAAPADANTVTGTLLRVGYTDRELVLIGPGPKGPQSEIIVGVPQGVRVLRDGKEILFEEVKDGEKVAIQTDKVKGKLWAKTIQLGTAVVEDAPEQPLPTTRVRQILQIADRVLQIIEEQRRRP